MKSEEKLGEKSTIENKCFSYGILGIFLNGKAPVGCIVKRKHQRSSNKQFYN